MKDYFGDPAAREKARKPRTKQSISSAIVLPASDSDREKVLKEFLLSVYLPGSATSLYGGGIPFAIKP
jgi:hypothetical protein